jgi:hypothetical protein
MARPRLNKKQRSWIESFKQQHPGTRIENIYEGLCGDRIVILEWTESLPKIQLPNITNSGYGWISNTLKVKLRIFGDLRHQAEYQYHIVYPHCEIDDNTKLSSKGQLSLPLPQLLNIKIPKVPVKFKPKKRRCTSSKRHRPVQLKLPLFGVAYQLHQINLSQGERITSEQELLLETIPHRDLETGKEVNLPAAIIKILQAKKATLKEWESAVDLYQVAGPSGVLAYLEGLDSLRIFFGTEVVKPLKQSSDTQLETVTIVESKL